MATKKRTTKAKTNSAPTTMLDMMEYYLVEKSPIALPMVVKTWLLTYGPWVLVGLCLIWAQALIQITGLQALLSPIVHLTNPLLATSIGAVAALAVLELILTVCALPGLFARRRRGWNLLLLVTFIGLARGIIATGSIISSLVISVLSWYVLFQLRSSYR